ncbi:MAG: cytochrome c-type biogenesis protein [Halieaceae bacterium]|nr:cytochrome c-type biogenesis protein [Halieaceae bacterium]
MLALLPAAAFAVIETYDFDNASLQQRFKTLAAELRCPKCQNQNIADSNAPIAADLRKQLHAQLHKGASDEEIVEYMVSRYGEFVLYRPRVNQVTLVLWLAPALLLLLAIVIVITSFRARASAESVELSAEEKARLDALLETGSKPQDD